MRVARGFLMLSLLMLTACGGYKKDLETICSVRSRVKVPHDADKDKEESVIAEYLMTHVHTPKAKKMFAKFGSMPVVDKARLLRKEAASEGVSPCELADEFDPSGAR